jgi:hypothetical protein
MAMNVTLHSNPGQASPRDRAWLALRSRLAPWPAGLTLAAGIARAETMANLAAVNTNGVSTWNVLGWRVGKAASRERMNPGRGRYSGRFDGRPGSGNVNVS